MSRYFGGEATSIKFYPKRGGYFRYEIVCGAGVLCCAGGDDFLSIVLRARAMKRRFQETFPGATIRVRLFNPNGSRVSHCDIRTSLESLAIPSIRAAVLQRVEAAFAAVPARSEARTGTAAKAAGFSGFGGSGFRQAGVVAPPDSPDLGNSSVSATAFFPA